MNYPKTIINIIECFKKFPGIGEKTAERMALATLDMEEDSLELFSKSLKNVKTKIKKCEKCGVTYDDNVKFCDKCGSALVNAPQQAAPQQAAPQQAAYQPTSAQPPVYTPVADPSDHTAEFDAKDI